MKKILFGLLVAGLLTACGGDAGTDTAETSGASINTRDTSDLVAFAQCVNESGAVFYGTEWCPHCKQQKAILGAGLSETEYVDCDVSRLRCSKAGVKAYPTWVTGDDQQLVGTQQLSDLAGVTGCELPNA